MRRPNRLAAGFVIAAVLFAACVPGLASVVGALAEPFWLLLPDEQPLGGVVPTPAEAPRPPALPTDISPRGPPADSLA